MRHLCNLDRSCVLCDLVDEDLTHLLFKCPISLSVWGRVGDSYGCISSCAGCYWNLFVEWCSLGNNKDENLKLGFIWMMVVWCLWKVMNDFF